jgi:hypothetical protein
LVLKVTKNPMVTPTVLQSSSEEMGEPSRRATISAALSKRHKAAHLEFAQRLLTIPTVKHGGGASCCEDVFLGD